RGRPARAPPPTPSPYTTLFRSRSGRAVEERPGRGGDAGAVEAERGEDVVRLAVRHELHRDAQHGDAGQRAPGPLGQPGGDGRAEDRKSTRLNSSHVKISYAVFC